MKQSRFVTSCLAAASLATLSACATDPNTGQKRISRTAIGAGIGAVGGLLVGGLVGGTGAKVIGAGIGGVAGAAVGAKNDQPKGRREQTEGTAVEPPPVDEGSPAPR
jgi:uncharacterized membrane protein